MNKTVQVTFDDSIVEKLRNAFTSMDCIYKEAMQNARRAGASFVKFESEDGYLKIIDNGKGFDSLQDFLTLAGSGWDKKTTEKEDPFGLGSFSMLYASDHIKVSSNNESFEGFTDDILRGLPVHITSSSVSEGSVIELACDKLPKDEHLYETINRLACGFAIDVFVNGTQCEQPHRLTDEYIDIGIGKAFIPGVCNNAIPSSRYDRGSTILYFQGLRVDVQRYEAQPYTVVHLDEQQFEIRMPDRDVLIDQEKQNKLIDDKIELAWADYLTAKKAELSSEAFVKLYKYMHKHHCLYLLNDVPLVPEEALFVVDESPYCERIYHDDNFTKSISKHRNDIGKVLAIENYVDEETIDQWLYAYHSEALCYSSASLDKGHWLHTHITDVNSDAIEVSCVNRRTQTAFEGDFVWMSCEFGEKVRLDGPLGVFDVDNEVVFSQNTMFIPANFTDGEAINKASCFTTDDSFDETAFYIEEQIFGAFLTRHNGNVLDAFKSALDNPYINGLGLNDKQFKVVFHAKGFEVEEIAA